MNNASLIGYLSDLHFLRPWWFLALGPAGLLLWFIYRRQDSSRAWRGIIADHLLLHLLSDPTGRRRIGAVHLLCLGWALTLLSLAGPVWHREKSPFTEDNAALAIVIKVSPSMRTDDIQPDRLTRSIQKIHDLLDRRRGAKTALIAYEGSAHVVMPITTDEGIIATFADALDPRIMPKEGDVAATALKLADKVLSEGGDTGSILWITDGVAPEEKTELDRWHNSSKTPVRILAPLQAGPEFNSLRSHTDELAAHVFRITPDDADIDELAQAARFFSAPTNDLSTQWSESGYWLTPLLTLLMLPFFRRGWLVPTASIR